MFETTYPAITVDPEFHDLIPALTADEYAALEESLLNEGCRDALVVWRGENILVDGHNRYELCTRHNLPYQVVEREFEDRDHAMLWMLRNQKARRNYTDYLRDLAAIKEQEIIARIAKKNQAHGNTAPGKTLYSNLEQSVAPVHSWQEAAKNNQTSIGSMHRTKFIEDHAPVAVKEKARKGEITRNAAYELTKAVEQLPEAEREAIQSAPVEEIEAAVTKPAKFPDYDTEEAFYRADRKSDFKHKQLMTSDSPEWYTPPHVIERVVKVMGAIDLDPCSNSRENPNVPAKLHYTAFEDGLSAVWEGRVYMNPPYGREIGDWTEKVVAEYEAGNITQALLLLPARTDTQWFQGLRDYMKCFLFGRLKFSGHDNAATFPNVVVSLGCDRTAFIQVFGEIGDVYERVTV